MSRAERNSVSLNMNMYYLPLVTEKEYGRLAQTRDIYAGRCTCRQLSQRALDNDELSARVDKRCAFPHPRCIEGGLMGRGVRNH